MYNKNSVVYAAIQSTCWFDESALVWYIDSLLLGSSHISSLSLSLCLSVLHARPRHKLNNNAGRLCFFLLLLLLNTLLQNIDILCILGAVEYVFTICFKNETTILHIHINITNKLIKYRRPQNVLNVVLFVLFCFVCR